MTFTVPPQPSPTALYYFFDAAATIDGPPRAWRLPRDGADVPLMHVISRDHLRDLDVDDYALDVFDIVRMVRHHHWGEPLAHAGRLDLDGDGSVTDRDVRHAVALVLHERDALAAAPDEVAGISPAEAAVTVSLRDGSALSIPRTWSGLVTDLPLRTVGVGSLAAQLVGRSRPLGTIRAAAAADKPAPDRCLVLEDPAVNRVPYRRQPHELRRFTALALANISHDPAGYLKGSARRALRVFVIEGSSDTRTAYQFKRAGIIYAAGRVASIVYFALFAVGLGIALAQRMTFGLLLIPIVYVPLTICFMLINARYSMTTQPFVFAFVAVALLMAKDAWTRARERRAPQSPRSPAAAPRSPAAGSDAAHGYRSPDTRGSDRRRP